MFKFGKKFLDFEKNNRFIQRVLFLSIPTAFIFILLVAVDLMSMVMAIVSFTSIIIFNIILLFPITFEMQQVKKYIENLASGQNVEDYNMKLSEKDSQAIVEAVNAMHSFWAQKNDILEAQTISDTAVLDSLPDPIMMIDRSGNILGANLSARTLFGKNITNKNVDKLFNSNNFIEAVSRVLKKESTSENLIFYVKQPNQQKLYAHIKQLPWLSKGRAVAVISIYDMTKALKIEKMQSDFVANASHELRTPLAIISGFIETLQTSAHDDEKARDHFLAIMKDQAEYMSALIENLLSLSRIELNQDQRPSEKADVEKLIDEVKLALDHKAQEREMNIVVEKEAHLPEITADKAQVKQIIQNLTDNALKYGTAKTDITISVHRANHVPPSKSYKVAEGEALAISVNNKGHKISPEDLARLTERFFRLQEHKDLNIKGTGLGLSIAKQIILRHRGNLTVSSTTYQGTTFTIYLPVEQ